jgi:hypothetical protein
VLPSRLRSQCAIALDTRFSATDRSSNDAVKPFDASARIGSTGDTVRRPAVYGAAKMLEGLQKTGLFAQHRRWGLYAGPVFFGLLCAGCCGRLAGQGRRSSRPPAHAPSTVPPRSTLVTCGVGAWDTDPGDIAQVRFHTTLGVGRGGNSTGMQVKRANRRAGCQMDLHLSSNTTTIMGGGMH